jgi:hypothetical protein
VVWSPLRGVLLVPLALVIFIEEWGWQPFAAMLVRHAPPRLAPALFLVPAILPRRGQDRRALAGPAGPGDARHRDRRRRQGARHGARRRLIILVEPQLMAFAWFARCVAWRGRRAIGAGQCCDNRSSGAAHA